MREYLIVALKGAAMGIAEVIPGVSGGTIALVAGIYDRLVGAIASLRPEPLRHLPYLYRRPRRAALVDELREMDIPFLVALGGGMVVMVIALARIIEGFIEAFPGITYAFFGGLIAASALLLYAHVEVNTPGRVILAVVSIAIAYLLSGVTTTTLGNTYPVLFGAGAIAITALVLPGVSGSFLLLALGQYEFMLGALNDLVDTLADVAAGGGSLRSLIETTQPVAVFLLGAFIGLLTVAHVVDFALERAKTPTLIVLVGLMVGALRIPGAEVAAAYTADGMWILATVSAAVVGVIVIYLFDYYTGELEY